MKTCIIQVHGPMSSWGEPAIGGVRLTASRPSRSAILGLIGASLGVRREDSDVSSSLSNVVKIAVKMNESSSLIKDYHTTQYPKYTKTSKRAKTRKEELQFKNVSTYLSSREYLCDSYCLVAICVEDNDEWTLEQIVSAFKNPYFHVFLGRKASPPALPFCPQIIEADNLKQAFEMAVFPKVLPIVDEMPEWLSNDFECRYDSLTRSVNSHMYWEDGMESGVEYMNSTNRYDNPVDRSRWQFSRRKEFMAILEKGE